MKFSWGMGTAGFWNGVDGTVVLLLVRTEHLVTATAGQCQAQHRTYNNQEAVGQFPQVSVSVAVISP